jgi:hypothetical protein
MIFQIKITTQDAAILIAVEALSYKEAETKAEKIMTVMGNEFSSIETVVKTTFKEFISGIVDKNAESTYYKAKVAYMTVSDNGKEKSVKNQILVHAHDARNAHDTLEEHAEEYLDGARVYGFEETDIHEYYDHEQYLRLDLQSMVAGLKEAGLESVSINQFV